MRYLEYIKNTDATISWKTKSSIRFNAKIIHKIIKSIMMHKTASIYTFNNHNDASSNSTIISIRGKLAEINTFRSVITDVMTLHIHLYSMAYNIAKSYTKRLNLYFTINNNQSSYITGLESIIKGLVASKTITSSPIPSTYINNTEHYINNIARILSSLTEIRNKQKIVILLKTQRELDEQLTKIIQTVHHLGIKNEITIVIDEFKEIDTIYKEIAEIYTTIPEIIDTNISLGVRTTIENIHRIADYECINSVILNPLLTKKMPEQYLDTSILIA